MLARIIESLILLSTWLKKGQRAASNGSPVMVNLGSGLTVAPGWVHVDGSLNALAARLPKPMLKILYRWSDNRQWFSHEQYVRILTEHRFVHHRLQYGVPFDDGTVDVVYSSHALEHIFLEEAQALLLDAYRALKKGGLIRLAVPDLEYAVRLYQSGAKEQALAYFFNPNRAGYLNHHHYMYDFEMLKNFLEKAGFVEVERCRFREGKMKDAAVLDNRPEESLFVEARK
jgi:predicted SAM-dependent methyltransferase